MIINNPTTEVIVLMDWVYDFSLLSLTHTHTEAPCHAFRNLPQKFSKNSPLQNNWEGSISGTLLLLLMAKRGIRFFFINFPFSAFSVFVCTTTAIVSIQFSEEEESKCNEIPHPRFSLFIELLWTCKYGKLEFLKTHELGLRCLFRLFWLTPF